MSSSTPCANLQPDTPLPRRRLLQLGALSLAAGYGLPGYSQSDPTASTPVVPDYLQAVLPQARLSGSQRFRVWGFAVYDAQLWVAPGFDSRRWADSPLALKLDYLRTLDGPAIAERSLVEMRRAADINPQQASDWLAAMQQAFPDVQNGDHITGVHQPGVGARFWFNGKPRASINDPIFSRLFFGIWLAPTTSEPALRSALLGNT